MKRLVHRIDALARKDEMYLKHAAEIGKIRLAAAAEFHKICREFVDTINRLTADSPMTIDPADFSTGLFRDDSLNLIQISVRGRILQMEYTGTPETTSTEDFRIPYTLHGTVRAFNQDLLSKELIEEQLVFYTIEKQQKMWRYFDSRTYRTGPFDQEFLITVMEQVV